MKYVNRSTLETVFRSEVELLRWAESIYGYAERGLVTVPYTRPHDYIERTMRVLDIKVVTEDEELGWKGVF